MATIHDIARIVGVSPALVSLALNGKPRVSPETAAEIIKTANKIGYRRVADRAQKTGTVRFIRFTKAKSFLRESHTAFFAEYVEGAEQYLNEQGYRFEVSSFAGDKLADIAHALEDSHLQGAVILATELDPDDMTAFSSKKVPLVFLDVCHAFLPYDYCTMNNNDALFLAVSHLREMGHREIGLVASDLDTGNFSDRTEAFLRLLNFFKLKGKAEWRYRATPEASKAAEELRLAFEKNPPPPALFCHTDNLAYGCFQALASLGLRVPEDVSIIGFDDLPFSQIMQPPLTTVSVPTTVMGSAAAQLLAMRIANPGRPPEKRFCGCELTVRKSVFRRGEA